MATIFDMTRRVTMHDVGDQNLQSLIEGTEHHDANAPPQQANYQQEQIVFSKVFDFLLLQTDYN